MAKASSGLALQKARLEQSAATYDIFNELARNSSANFCVSELGMGGSCIAGMEKELAAIYGMNVSLSLNSSTARNATCLPVYLQRINRTEVVCVAVGG